MSERLPDPSVLDLMAWESWSPEMKRVARAGLYLETVAQREDMEEEIRSELAEIDDVHREDAERWRALVRHGFLAVDEDGGVMLVRRFADQDDYRENFAALMAMLDSGTVPMDQGILFFDHAGGV